MGQFVFKSSGVTQQTAPANQIVATPLPIGILTPLKLGSPGLLQTSTDLATQVGDNLRNLIQTNWGERLGLYSFGANLRPLLVDFVSTDDFDSQAISRISAAVAAWMPFVELQDFLSSFDKAGSQTTGLAAATITVRYNVPALAVKGKVVKVTLYVM